MKQLWLYLEDTESMERFSPCGQHIIEHISAKLLYSVLNHTMRNQNIANCILIVVRNTKQICLVTCKRNVTETELINVVPS